MRPIDRLEEIRTRQAERRKLAAARGADIGANALYQDIDFLLGYISAQEDAAVDMLAAAQTELARARSARAERE